MPALNFKARFAPLVEAGQKVQTIRAFRADGRDPRPGQQLYLYTGMRTKACRRLGVATCSAAKPVTICAEALVLDEHVFKAPGWLDVFAKADGFENWAELVDWFTVANGRKLPWRGLVVYWLPLQAGAPRKP